jgi:hypothetical protein
MDVADRVDVRVRRYLGRSAERLGIGPLADEELFRRVPAERRPPSVHERQPHVRALAGGVERHDCRGAHQRVVPVPARDLHESVARVGRHRRELDLRQHLVRCEYRRQRPDEEIRRVDPPLVTRPRPRAEPCVERQRHGRKLGGRVGVCDAPADRPAVPDLRVGDVGHRLGHQRRPRRDQGAPLGVPLPRHRADADSARRQRREPRQRVDPVQVDDHRGPREPEVEQRDQTLPTREHLRFVPMHRECLERLLERLGGEVLERGRFHRPTLPRLTRGRKAAQRAEERGRCPGTAQPRMTRRAQKARIAPRQSESPNPHEPGRSEDLGYTRGTPHSEEACALAA